MPFQAVLLICRDPSVGNFAPRVSNVYHPHGWMKRRARQPLVGPVALLFS